MLKRWAAWPRGARWLAGIAAVVLGLAIAWAMFVPIANWLARYDVGSATGTLHETALDNARGRLLTLGAGLLAAGALLFTARTFALSREGQVTDRYTKAIEDGLTRAQASAALRENGLSPRLAGFLSRDGLITREGDRRWLTDRGREWVSQHQAA